MNPFRSTLLVIPLVVVMCAFPAFSWSRPQPTPDARRLNLESFEHVWKTVLENHFDATFGGVDWNAVRLEFRPRIEKAHSKDDVRAILGEMLSRLKLSHSVIIPSELYENESPAGGRPAPDGTTGIQVRAVDSRALVVSLDPGSPAEKMGVRRGWEIVRIGTQEVPRKLALMTKEFEGKPVKDLVLSDAVASRLEGRIGESIDVLFRDIANREVPMTIPLAAPRGEKFQIGNMPAGHVWIETIALGSDIGYIAFNAFIAPGILMPPFNRAMTDFRNTDGIIIDLRGNTGGQGDILVGMAGWFVAEKGRYFGQIRSRSQTLKLLVRPRPDVYPGRVAILVDGLSLCATEVFAGGLRDLGRARIFGARTGGIALSGTVEKLPNGDRFMYPFADYTTAGGQVLEGNGLTPDVEVQPTREALLQNRDLVLEAAVRWIRKQAESELK